MKKLINIITTETNTTFHIMNEYGYRMCPSIPTMEMLIHWEVIQMWEENGNAYICIAPPSDSPFIERHISVCALEDEMELDNFLHPLSKKREKGNRRHSDLKREKANRFDKKAKRNARAKAKAERKGRFYEFPETEIETILIPSERELYGLITKAKDICNEFFNEEYADICEMETLSKWKGTKYYLPILCVLKCAWIQDGGFETPKTEICMNYYRNVVDEYNKYGEVSIEEFISEDGEIVEEKSNFYTFS